MSRAAAGEPQADEKGSHALHRLTADFPVSSSIRERSMDRQDMHDHDIHEHHEKAADHHEHAAEHHRKAAKFHKAGKHEKAAHHSKVAHGHHLHAVEHHEHAAKLHAEEHGGEHGEDRDDD
jgi:hypothetical protein